jgi:hypothetical protein
LTIQATIDAVINPSPNDAMTARWNSKRHRNTKMPEKKFNSPHRSKSGPQERSNGKRLTSPTNHKTSLDRYIELAREATISGDSISAENYYQHAEHYFRLMNPGTDQP